MREPTPGQEADEEQFQAMLENYGRRWYPAEERRKMRFAMMWGKRYGLELRGCDETCPCRSGERKEAQ